MPWHAGADPSARHPCRHGQKALPPQERGGRAIVQKIQEHAKTWNPVQREFMGGSARPVAGRLFHHEEVAGLQFRPAIQPGKLDRSSCSGVCGRAGGSTAPCPERRFSRRVWAGTGQESRCLACTIP